MIDNKLRAGMKTLRTVPGGLLLGSTGARLWADYVKPAPGFAGRFDFIHKVNIPLLFQISINGRSCNMDTAISDWYPSQLRMTYTDDWLRFEETKFITWDDCAVSCQSWTNRSDQEIRLKLEAPSGFAAAYEEYLQGGFDIPFYSFDIDACIAASDSLLLNEGIKVAPGEVKTFIVVLSAGIRSQDPMDTLKDRAVQAVGKYTADLAKASSEQEKAFEKWFDGTPRFKCNDPLLNKTWAYRWFLLRHNLADPRYGLLQHPLFYEGRSHKKSKRPFSKGGWEFSKLINLSVPLHMTDAKWHHDSAASMGALRNMQDTPAENGMYCCLTVDERMHSFANYIGWAAYQLFLVHRDEAAVLEALPGLKAQVASWQEVYGNETDGLMTEYRHTRTGKEYQPSYWYFHNYPQNPKDPETYTHVKRVDRTVYHYMNIIGVARLCEMVGDPEAAIYLQLAERVKNDVLVKMWDEATAFFYDLHYQTDEKAFVKNIVGFYPAWAGLLDSRHDQLVKHLLNPGEFATTCRYPSVSADSTAYAKEGGWFGLFVKGRNGCMWNGPTWPYTNAITLDALARESKRSDHAYDGEFAKGLREYSFLHFQNRDLSRPCLVEHYNSQTGEPLSDEQEYNHSYYIDLIISHVAGLSLSADSLSLEPLDIGLDYFELDRVKAAGQDIRITYGKPGLGRYPDGIEEGYRLYVNGRLVCKQDRLASVQSISIT
ncbi:hypothetical protein FHS19_000812 [Paenibacillus rhizosphaerae]|uniref:Mannosylglycerate hydrolase MGH1-like glycoside hydrolase domain-containing protein n=1 Tax=Paenibacillus rhizosphaerae TaxID=297318 RepID=A0A839TL78_9BACL|nr:hypothetical protein [Paenibacillus rhizosphaerae]MBB3126158.1 hypothetical protein [Paenibacillus rhizosphaerae]